MKQDAEHVARSIAHAISQEIEIPWGRLWEIVSKSVQLFEQDLIGKLGQIVIQEGDWLPIEGSKAMISGARYARMVHSEKIAQGLQAAIEGAKSAKSESLSLQLAQEIVRS